MESLNAVVKGDQRALARALGGLLLGIAMLVIVTRRTYALDPWGDFAIFATLLIPTVVLYGAGVLGGRARDSAPTGWQIVFAGFGILLLPVMLYALLQWVGGNADSNWNTIWIFGLVAAAALGAALAAGVRVGCLLGALALLIIWFALWDEVVSGGLEAHISTTRWLFVIAAVLLGGLASAISIRSRPEGGASDVITVAGLAAIGAGALSLIALSTPVVGFSELGEPSSSGGSSTFWELELLVVSLALILHGATAAVRGPVYVGVLGLLAFIPVVGFDAGDLGFEGSLWGWPVVLLVASLVLLTVGTLPVLGRGRD